MDNVSKLQQPTQVSDYLPNPFFNCPPGPNNNGSHIPTRIDRTPPARPITSVIDLTGKLENEGRSDDDPPAHVSVSEIFEPTQSSSGSLVPCHTMNGDRYFILAEKLPRDVIRFMSYKDCYMTKGTVHFEKTLYPKIASVLISLNPPITTYRPGEDVVILKPTQSSSGSVVPCYTMSNSRYFILAEHLPQVVIDIMTHRDCHKMKEKVHFRKVLYPKISSLLKLLNPPINTYLSDGDAKPQISIDDNWEAEIQAARLRVSETETVRNRANNFENEDCATGILPPRVSSTSSRLGCSFKIPGYEILKHLISPSSLRKASDGNLYITFVMNPISDITRFCTTKNGEKIILRLIQSEGNATAAGESFQEAGNSMIIEYIRFNGQSPSFPERTKAGHFNVDVTPYLKGGVETTVEISAQIVGCKTNDTVVYSISIVRILNANEMMKDLRAKLQIPVNLTKKLVLDSLTEAAENGILASDSKLSVSLKCPLGKKQMVTPTRGVHCDHFLCFDALNFLQTYEKVEISKWTCPVCDSHLDYEDLRVDSFFYGIVNWVGEDCKDFSVKIDISGSYSVETTNALVSENQPIALVDEEEDTSILQSKNKRTLEEIDSSSDEDDYEPFTGSRVSTKPSRSKRSAIEGEDGRPVIPETQRSQVKKEAEAI